MKLPATFKAAIAKFISPYLWVAILCLNSLLPYTLFAQKIDFRNKLQFQHIGTEKGLPQNWGWAIEQDREGFMWFGNYDGVYKYDGYGATRYGYNPSDVTHSLRSNLIGAIHEDRKGRLWIATWGGGLHQIDKRTGQASAYPVEDKGLSLWDQQSDIYEDKQGVLWIGTFGGIARFDPDKHTYSLYATPDKSGINQLQEDATGKLWSGSYQFDPKTEKYTLYPLLTPNGSQLITPIGFDIDSEGIAWMGIEGGLYCLDTRNPYHYTLYAAKELINKSIIRVKSMGDFLLVGTTQGLVLLNKRTHEILTYQSNPSNPGSLSNDFVSSIYFDRNGNLWLNTQNGINMASTQNKLFQAYQIIPTPASFHQLENEIFSVVEDTTGTIWVSSGGHGLYRMNPATHQFSPVEVNPLDKSTAKLRSGGWPLLEDRQGRLWIGADDGLYQLDRATGTFIHYDCQIAIHLLDTDASGKIWIATAGGVGRTMASFDPLTGKFAYYQADEKDSISLLTGFYNDLMVSRTGEVWLATSMGVGRMNPKTGRSIRYQPNYRSPNSSLSEPQVMALYEDEEGNIWIGTHGGGLNRLNPNTNTFTYFTTKDGLPNNRIMSITGDHKGNLWLGTGNGLSRFNPNTNTFHNFDITDGLPGSEFLERGNTFRRNGKLFFGNKDGLVVFYPDSIKAQILTSPLYITGFKLLEKSLPVPVDKIELSYKENFFSFEFASLEYQSPEKIKYAYQLTGVDKDWVYSENRRLTSYTDIAPGNYIFWVKATNDGSTWTQTTTPIHIIIHAPPWKTSWAYALYGLALVGAILGLIYYTKSRERLKADLKFQKMESLKLQEIDKLKSHFFANISHEFRTPLTLILSPLEGLIASAREQPQQLSKYQTMYRNARRLLTLINQLLDLSKVEAGKMQIDLKRVNLVQILKRILLSFSSLAERRNIHFSYQYPTDTQLVYLDSDKLEKIVSNLLSNAFKFTPEGGEVSVSISLEQADEKAISYTHKFSKQIPGAISSKLLKVAIQDNGIGIPEDRLEKIFDRFYQLDSSATREGEGTGIGLALVKELIDLLQGEISVESMPHVRTCFSVRLPVLISGMEQITVVESSLDKGMQPVLEIDWQEPDQLIFSAIDSQAENMPLVLIVEDNQELRTYLHESLASSYHILEATNGLEGYNRAVERIPDLVLSDVMMPKMDGTELCQKLKADERTSHIPIILLTAKGDRESKLEGLEIGVDEYLTKPFESTELLLRIKNLIEGRKKLRERYSREITLQPSAISITSADERFLQKLMQALEGSIAESTFGVEELGQELAMSRMQLFRKLKALTNQSPGEFIRSLRLQRGAELLAKGAGTVAEVAFLVGFNDPSYFTKCFQKQYGKTPSDYVESIIKAN